ncbi:hypothetical protein DM860_010407 [Cuscuta australis]|uniref:Myb-like domain-containing protein n=1 Tax=Cuscuta australis TaxID=267555 RepID=A0A328E519_9ASTE|nr:hypothetical protein DM860_010407 [Cuscuta australis]
MDGGEDHYGMPPDLRQFISNTTTTPPLFISPPIIPPHHGSGRDLAQPPPSHRRYDMVMPPPSRGGFHREFLAESAAASAAAGFGALEMEAPGGGGGNGRWPRQETLTLLEIRSRLDYKFKEANQKGPLWDEVSRIMSEEHGYERSGKKCREKFENLYKYYKKTKDGKGGRQDGKHYRFFRQLEALYGGETCAAASVSQTQPTTFHCNDLTAATNDDNANAGALHRQTMMSAADSLSLSDSSEYDTSSSDDIIDQQGDETSAAGGRRRKGKGRWKGKVKEFIDGQMRKLMEKQEAWLDKIMKTIEKKEQERTAREEEWRRKEEARMENEQAFWAHERAWIKARDSALMDALHKASNVVVASSETTSEDDTWTEDEVSKLVQIRNNMGPRFDHHARQNVVVVGGNNGNYHHQDDDENDVLWEEIATKMSYLGYDRSGAMCRDKWLHINNSYVVMNQCNTKKRKDYNNPGGESCYYMDGDNGGGSYGNCPMEQQQQQKDMSVESCFRLLMGDHCESVWDNYGLKLNDRRN